MLKAHSLRLNPLAHSSVFQNSSDILDLLNTQSTQCDKQEIDKDNTLVSISTATSPKKQASRFSNNLNTVIGKNIKKSPNSKKTTHTKSPNSKRLSPPMVQIAKCSPAIQTAKKLKLMIDINNDETLILAGTKSTPVTIPTTTTIVSTISSPLSSPEALDETTLTLELRSNKRAKSSSSLKLISKQNPLQQQQQQLQLQDEESETSTLIIKHEHFDGNEKSNDNDNVIDGKTIWTREEDKLILEQIQLGFNSEEELFIILQEKLTNRNYIEISERFKFLMDFLNTLNEN